MGNQLYENKQVASLGKRRWCTVSLNQIWNQGFLIDLKKQDKMGFILLFCESFWRGQDGRLIQNIKIVQFSQWPIWGQHPKINNFTLHPHQTLSNHSIKVVWFSHRPVFWSSLYITFYCMVLILIIRPYRHIFIA